jgi:hypothetical protein
MEDEIWNKHRSTFESRGVSREVAEARPYVRYERGQREVGDRYFADVPPRQRGTTITRRINYSGGWVMPRYAVLDGLQPVLPEFGPSEPPHDSLEEFDNWHDHTWPPRWVNHILSRGGHARVNVKGVHLHPHEHDVEKEHDGTAPEGEHEHEHRHDSVEPRIYERHIEGERSEHEGDPYSSALGPHNHPVTKKYLFAPAPWEVTEEVKLDHDHRDDMKAEPHPHDAGVHEHVVLRRRKAKGHAMRLDVHPSTWKLFPDAEQVFWSIEGVLKNDALLSIGEASFDVPSVQQWDAPELEDFARAHLAGKQLYVVPDSDWATNAEVSLAAFAACEALRRLRGEDGELLLRQVAVAAATPEPGYCPRHDKPAGAKRGIDDYIADTGGVAGMVVVARKPSRAMRRWCHWYITTDRPGTYRNGRKRNADVLQALSLMANEHGRVARSERPITRFLGWGPTNVNTTRRAVEDLLSQFENYPSPFFGGALPDLFDREWRFEDGPLEDTEWTRTESSGKAVRVRGKGRRWEKDAGGWNHPPLLTIREDLRADEHHWTL